MMLHTPLDRESAHGMNAPTTSTVSARPITVLVVDDQALVRSALSQLLSSQPAIERVATAHTYAEAQERAMQQPPHVIWLDLHIARTSGIAAIHRLRQIAPAAHILALADQEDEQESFEAIMAGAQGYCSKQDIDTHDIMTIIGMMNSC
jgi:DNA-binding NarL/FixJ family response regulator